MTRPDRSAYYAARYAINRELRLAQMKARYWRNRETICAQGRAYRRDISQREARL